MSDAQHTSMGLQGHFKKAGWVSSVEFTPPTTSQPSTPSQPPQPKTSKYQHPTMLPCASHQIDAGSTLATPGEPCRNQSDLGSSCHIGRSHGPSCQGLKLWAQMRPTITMWITCCPGVNPVQPAGLQTLSAVRHLWFIRVAPCCSLQE